MGGGRSRLLQMALREQLNMAAEHKDCWMKGFVTMMREMGMMRQIGTLEEINPINIRTKLTDMYKLWWSQELARTTEDGQGKLRTFKRFKESYGFLDLRIFKVERPAVMAMGFPDKVPA